MAVTIKMVVDPTTPDDKLFSKYPLLDKITTEEGVKATPSLIKYIAYVYDPNSPLASSHPDLVSRKEHAKQLTKHSGTIDNHAIFVFIARLINNRLWTEIVANETVFDEYTSKVLNPIANLDEDKTLKAVQIKNTMLNQMGEMRQRIKKLRSELFSADEALVESSKEKLRLTAENIAHLVDE